MYDVDDAVAKIDGYIISIAGAAPHVGEKRMVRIDQVGRTAASALLLDEAGEVIVPPPRTPAPAKRRPRRRAAQPKSGGLQATPKVDAEAGAEAGLAPALEPASAAEPDQTPLSSSEPTAQEGEDGLQSKPRRRGRRGGRRRSAAKAKAAAVQDGTE